MRKIMAAFAISCLALSTSQALSEDLFDFKVKTIDVKSFSLSDYKTKKKAFLIVNTASKCGYTDQYEGLQKLYESHKDQGLVVLGFPSNDFGGQEPENNSKIKKFCKLNYGVKFPLFSKGPVKGGEAQPLFQWLTKAGGPVKWNFEKFLVDAQGKLIKRFRSGVTPNSDELMSAIETTLANGSKSESQEAPKSKKKTKSKG
jgi:glutathione peroxidase